MRSVRALVLLAVATACVIAGGCERPSADRTRDDEVTQIEEGLEAFEGLEGTVRIAGGTAHLHIMNEAARRIHAANPDIRFEIEGGHSRTGVERCAMGAVDIGNTGRWLTEDEKARYPDLVSFEFARDAIVLIVNPANPIVGLTSEQVRDIYAGRVTDWAAVGGTEGPIHAFTYDAASGTCEVFREAILAGRKAADSVQRVATMLDAADQVAENRWAIAYTGLAETDERVKVLTLDGVRATEDSIRSGAYPLTRPLVMNTKGQPEGLVKAFVEYVMSEHMAEFIREDGYVPAN